MSAISAQNDAPIGYSALIRGNDNFRRLWFGQIISLGGDWFNLIASASLVALLTQSGTAIGGLFVVRMLAPFLVSPIAGVVADRYNRRHILILADISRAIIVLGFLFVRNPGQIWLLYTLTAVQLGISGFFFPTRNAILPDITSRREMGAANALSSATWSVMLALGAALGGLVSGIWGIYPAFVVDALSFLASAFFISQIAYHPEPGLKGADRTISAGLRQYLDGLLYLRQHPDILFIALHKAANSLLVAGSFQVAQVVIAEQVFVIGKEGGISLGLMYTAVGIGTGIGPIIVRRFTGDRDWPMRLALILGYFITAVGLLMAAPLTSFPLLLGGTFLRGLGTGIAWVFSTQLLLELLPNRVRGRVFSTEFAIFTLMTAISAAIAGQLIDTPLGIGGMMYGMAGLLVIPGALWALWLGLGRRAQPSETTGSNL